MRLHFPCPAPPYTRAIAAILAFLLLYPASTMYQESMSGRLQILLSHLAVLSFPHSFVSFNHMERKSYSVLYCSSALFKVMRPALLDIEREGPIRWSSCLIDMHLHHQNIDIQKLPTTVLLSKCPRSILGPSLIPHPALDPLSQPGSEASQAPKRTQYSNLYLHIYFVDQPSGGKACHPQQNPIFF